MGTRLMQGLRKLSARRHAVVKSMWKNRRVQNGMET